MRSSFAWEADSHSSTSCCQPIPGKLDFPPARLLHPGMAGTPRNEVVTRTLSKSVYLGARRAYSQRHRARRFPRPRGETMKSSLLSTLLLGVASTLPLAMAQSPGTFTPTSDLTEPRREHTATLLTN